MSDPLSEPKGTKAIATDFCSVCKMQMGNNLLVSRPVNRKNENFLCPIKVKERLIALFNGSYVDDDVVKRFTQSHCSHQLCPYFPDFKDASEGSMNL